MLPTILKALLLFGATAQALAIPALYSSDESISQAHEEISPLTSRQLENDNLDSYHFEAFDEGQDEAISPPTFYSSSPVANTALSKRGWKKWWHDFFYPQDAAPVYVCGADGCPKS